jgi:hypothetical protein
MAIGHMPNMVLQPSDTVALDEVSEPIAPQACWTVVGLPRTSKQVERLAVTVCAANLKPEGWCQR